MQSQGILKFFEKSIFQIYEKHQLSIQIYKQDQITPATEAIEACF